MGDTVTLWLVRWTPGREVWVLAQASPPRSKNGYRRITMEGVGVGVGGNLAMILILSTRESPVSDVGWNTGGGGITWLKCRPYLENLQVKLHESLGRIHLCWSFAFVLLWSIKWVTEWDTKGLLLIKDYYYCLHFQKIVLINCKDKTVTNLTSGESTFLIMLTKPKRGARGP